MTRSSPLRQSHILSSPDRRPLSSFLSDDRNNELSHRDALEAAQREHDRVREAAIRVYQLHELKEQRQRIQDEERKEEERIRIEKEIIAEEERLRQLKATVVPRPKLPEPEPEPEPAPAPTPAPKPAPATTTTPTVAQGSQRQPEFSKPANPFAPSAANSASSGATAFGLPKNETETKAPIQPNGSLSTPATTQNQNTSQPKTNGVIQQTAAAASKAGQPPASQAQTNPRLALVSKYAQIHQELKKLRKNLQNFAKTAGPPLKGKIGEFRREIRVSIGQLTAGRGANAQPMNKITTALTTALSGGVPSPPVDVNQFVVNPREPVEGAAHNDATLPALFIYLINICAKGIINQYINECGANPKAADPIGVFAAQIFSHTDFQWRGHSLVDILLAKFYKVCPILFGLRGNPKTERGRLALGWRKDGPGWESEQSHNDRMTGLGAGFASLSLRDFSKTVKTNPYPPANYWKALAGIVNTPQVEISNTHYVVLRAMIEGHEHRFLNFYGDAGLAALRVALVDFPTKAAPGTTAAASVQALAEVLKAESGLVLA